MGKASELFLGDGDDKPGFLQNILLSKNDDIVTNEVVIAKCTDYSRLLGLFDAIWSIAFEGFNLVCCRPTSKLQGSQML